MLPTESLLDVFMWLKRVDISCAVLTSQLFRNIAVKNISQLALHPVESITLSDESDDSTKWQLSVRYAEQVTDAADGDDDENDDDFNDTEEEESEQAEEFEFDADFDECFLRFTLVLQICSVDCCVIDASCGDASLSSAHWKSFTDATRSSNIVVMRLWSISLRQLKADEFFQLTRLPGLCDLLIEDCSLLAAFVDAKFIRECGECGITTLNVSPGPVDAADYATDDQSLLDFCFKRRAGTSPPLKLEVRLCRPTISADFVASFKQVRLFSGKQRQQSSSSAHSCMQGITTLNVSPGPVDAADYDYFDYDYDYFDYYSMVPSVLCLIKYVGPNVRLLLITD